MSASQAEARSNTRNTHKSTNPILCLFVASLSSGNDDHLGWEFHLIGGEEFGDGLLDLARDLRLLVWRELFELDSQGVGSLRAHGPELAR